MREASLESANPTKMFHVKRFRKVEAKDLTGPRTFCTLKTRVIARKIGILSSRTAGCLPRQGLRLSGSIFSRNKAIGLRAGEGGEAPDGY
jgi:hypothetical protein